MASSPPPPFPACPRHHPEAPRRLSAVQRRMVSLSVANVDPKHLLQHVSGRPIGHQGAQVSLKSIQLRRRPEMRRPVDPDLDRTARGAAKAGKPNLHLTEERGYRVLPVVLDVAKRPCQIDNPAAD